MYGGVTYGSDIISLCFFASLLGQQKYHPTGNSSEEDEIRSEDGVHPSGSPSRGSNGGVGFLGKRKRSSRGGGSKNLVCGRFELWYTARLRCGFDAKGEGKTFLSPKSNTFNTVSVVHPNPEPPTPDADG